MPVALNCTWIDIVMAGWQVIEDRPHQYYGAFLILSGLMVGVFTAIDGLLLARPVLPEARPAAPPLAA